MLLNNDNFDNFSHVGFNDNLQIKGLSRFTKNLEKHFFSQVTVRNYSPSNDSINLVVELDCNFGLRETLHHFEKNTWGNFESTEYSFAGAITELRECNDIQIDVEEFSLFLQDTSIIINRIYDQSIPEQLETIFAKLSEHAVHFSKSFTEVPYEIYVPVFEGDVMENEHSLLMNIRSDQKNAQDYFGFWGLYYYSQDDAVVYDLKNQLVIQVNLQMLHR